MHHIQLKQSRKRRSLKSYDDTKLRQTLLFSSNAVETNEWYLPVQLERGNHVRIALQKRILQIYNRFTNPRTQHYKSVHEHNFPLQA